MIIILGFTFLHVKYSDYGNRLQQYIYAPTYGIPVILQ